MARQDDYVRYTIRIPRDIYERIADLPGESSINAKIVNALDATASAETLRDKFAGQALSGLYAAAAQPMRADKEALAADVAVAFRIADAMLAERDK
jgi:hypothetical protein